MAMAWWEEERVGLVVLLLLLGAQAQQCQEGAGQSRLITGCQFSMPTLRSPCWHFSRAKVPSAQSAVLPSCRPEHHRHLLGRCLAPSHPPSCPGEGPSFEVAVLVLSGPANHRLRARLRQLTLPGFHLTFLFIIGRSGDAGLEEELEEVRVGAPRDTRQEARGAGDLLRVDVEESYGALPRKSLAGIQFVLTRSRAGPG